MIEDNLTPFEVIGEKTLHSRLYLTAQHVMNTSYSGDENDGDIRE